MEVKFKASNNVARIEITGIIGGWDIWAEQIRSNIKQMVAEGATTAHLYIHSEGGDVFEAEEIVNVLRGAFSTLKGEAGALVASAASRIALACSSFAMPANALMMIHRPMMGVYGNVKKIDAQMVALRAIDENYKTLYLSKTTDEKRFEEQWDAGQDIWLSAEQARALGFATKVIERTDVGDADLAAIAACGYKGDLKKYERVKEPTPVPLNEMFGFQNKM